MSTTLRAPEAAAFAAIADAVVAPEPPLPPVAGTDAVRAFASILAVSPAANRLGLRALLRTLDLAPLALPGEGAGRHRLHALNRAERTRALARLERNPALAGAVKALRGVAHLCYYGDAGVLRGLGYDPAAVVERARVAREAGNRW